MKSRIKNLLKNIPFVNHQVRAYEISKKFKTEIDLLKNRSKNDSTAPSIIHFSVNKAATQHVKGVLQKIAIKNDLKPVSIHDYAFETQMPFLDQLSYEEMETYKHIFKETGYLYSVFGGMVENIDNLNNYKILLSIRDPRDILVSSYYSIAYSHKVPPDTSGGKQKKFLDKREWVNSVNIDTYVLDQADAFYSIFNKYKTQLCNQHQVGILKYEDMVTNYEEWLMAIAKLTDMEIPDSIKHELIRNNRASTPLKENKFSHNRKGISGDYKEKLTAETIKELNTIFKPILSYFDYKNEEM